MGALPGISMGADCSCCGKANNEQFFLNPTGCCDGEAHWFCNCLSCPCVCPFQSCAIYCAPCFSIWCDRFCRCCWSPCKSCCPTCCCYYYEDAEFSGSSALGQTNIDHADLQWERASVLASKDDSEKAEMRLFDIGTGDDKALVEPGDIQQGALGDCWLLGAFAAFAEVPGGLQNLFVNKEASSRGKYKVRIYDAIDKVWTEVTVDDRIPVIKKSLRDGYVPTAAFARPNGNELWVMLLEKAFAKFCGSYNNLEGGQTVWGLQALTGSEICMRFLNEDGEWVRCDIENKGTPEKKRATKMTYHKDENGKTEKHDATSLFHVLHAYKDNSALIAASISNSSEEEQSNGLVAGHAYSVLRIEFVDPKGGGFLGLTGASKDEYLKMVQLRNPWGKGEWKGAWADSDSKWQEFPEVAKTLEEDGKKEKDGIFWMAWEDFIATYNNIEVCDRKQSLRDLTLEVHEEDGACGVCCGCLGGCCEYYVCCVGCHKLYCTRKPTLETIHTTETEMSDPSGKSNQTRM